MFKKFLFFLLIAIVVLQLFRPKLDNTAGTTGTAGINNHISVPQHVDEVLKTSCYDCHSNKTTYPWYASVQPVGWWLEGHIDEGKKELNFDEYGNYNLRRKYHKLEEIAELVEENEMPLSSYTLVHNDAKLTGDQKKLLVDWTSRAMNDMKAKYPIDSLIRKK